MRCLFLDRDGVVNIERGDYTWRIEDFVFTEGLFDSLRRIQAQGLAIIIVTNQGGIAKGRYSLQEYFKLTDWMKDQFKAEEVKLLDVFFSPHHDEHGRSLSRKPERLLFERALHRYEINASESVMVGDSERDIFAAQAVGIRGIKVKPNTALQQIESDILNG